MDVDFGWFADVIHFGDYPALVKRRFAQHLPAFTEAEKALLKGSYDAVGVTIYTGKYAAADPLRDDGWWVRTAGADGKLVGEQAESYWWARAVEGRGLLRGEGC